MAAAATDKAISIISSLDSRHEKIKQLLTCPICNKLLREVVAIDECLHLFCRKCITAKFTKEKLHKCPVCKVDLGVSPLQKLRTDHRWQSIRNSIKFKRRHLIERGLIQRKPKNKPPEVILDSSQSLPLIKESKEDEKEDEEEKYSPLPVKRKEKSISSVLIRAEKRTCYNHSSSPPANGRRKSTSSSRRGRGGTKSNHPRKTSSLIVSDHHVQMQPIQESLTNPVDGEQGTKQIIEPSNQEMLLDDKEGKREMNDSAIPAVVGAATGTSMDINMSAPCEPHTNTQENEAAETEDNHNYTKKRRKGKKEHIRDHHASDDHDDETASVPPDPPSSSGGGWSRNDDNINVRSSKKAVVTEDLNLPAQVVFDASSSKCFRSNHIWFSLVASDNQDSYVPLPPLPTYYVMIKDPNMPASFLRKYLVKKLRLCSENEVELSMRGKPISPDCPLDKLVDLWKETTPTFDKKPAIVGESAREYVMVVTYGRCATTFMSQ